MEESERTSQGLIKFQQGVDLDAEGKTAEAIESYREAVQICPDMPQAYFNLCVDLAILWQNDQALRAWRTAFWLNGNYRHELMSALDIYHEIRETEIMPCAGAVPAQPVHVTDDRTDSRRLT